MQLGNADPPHPNERKCVARRKTERLVDMKFSFAGTTKKEFGEADEIVGESKVSIQCQSLLAFSDALTYSLCVHLDVAQIRVRDCVVRRDGQHMSRGGFGSREPRQRV